MSSKAGTTILHLENVKCRLCNKCLKPKDFHYIFLKDINEVTTLGQRLMAILNIEANELQEISQVCCEMCAFKIQDIFSMLMEVHASNVIIKKIYEQSLDISENGIYAMIEPELLKCDKCNEKISDMKSYASHYEYHTLLEMTALIEEPEIPVKYNLSDNAEEDDNFRDDIEMMEVENNYDSVETKDDYIIIVKNENEEMVQVKEIDDIEDSSDDSDSDTDSLSEPEEYNCSYCEKKYIDKFRLRNHIFANHMVNGKMKEQRARVCRYCKNAIEKGHVKQHISNCKKEFRAKGEVLCDLCGKSMKPSSMEFHMRKHREISKGRQTCPICNKTFKHMKGLRSHMILHDDSRKVVCVSCGELCHPWTLWKHYKKHSGKSAKCHICGKAYTYNYMLQTHLKVHEKKEPNFSNNLPVYQCPKCDKAYSYVSMLNAHMQEEHNDDAEIIQVEVDGAFKCMFCEKTFDDHYSLRNHLLLMHEPSKEDLQAVRSRPAFGVFHCTYCEAVLRSEYGLRLHLKKEHNLSSKEMPDLMRRKCESCGKTFADKQGLTLHIRTVHLQLGKLECKLCGKTFDRYQGYANHKLMHSGAKPFECEVCSRTFRQRCDAVRHLQRHVRDGECTLEEATAKNNSESKKVRKSRIYLKDCFTNSNLLNEN